MRITIREEGEERVLDADFSSNLQFIGTIQGFSAVSPSAASNYQPTTRFPGKEQKTFSTQNPLLIEPKWDVAKNP